MDAHPKYGSPMRQLYGIYGKAGNRSITCDCKSEEDAVLHIMVHALTGEEVVAIVYRKDRYDIRARGAAYGKWKEIPTVLLRVGGGYGWWEAPPTQNISPPPTDKQT